MAASGASAADSLRIAVSRTPLSLPLFVAQEKGYFAAEGLDVQVDECLGGQRCLKSVLEGRADLATVGDLPIALNSFDRTDYSVIATFVNSNDDLKLIARQGGGSAEPLALAGKRIGVVIGSSAQYFLDLHLLNVGVDPRGLQIINFAPEETVDALVSGKVDAIAVWEPYGFLALKAMGTKARVLPVSSGYIPTFNLVAHRQWVGTRDASLVRVLRALQRSEQFIQQQPEAAKAILRKRLQLEQAFVDWVWPSFAYRLALDQALLTTMESQARWALREGHIKGKNHPNFLTLVHTAPLRAVKPTAVGLGR